MRRLSVDQANVVVPDVAGVTGFLRALGAEIVENDGEWAEWGTHHVTLRAVGDGVAVDLDSSAFASHWGGLPEGFTGVVVNLRAGDRESVDVVFERALALGAAGLRAPHDAFWGARYAVVRGPGPIVVGVMSPVDPTARTASPHISDFASSSRARRTGALCVFCGSSTGVDPAFSTTAAALGRAIAEAGLGLVYGGGHVGLMGVVADSAMAAGGDVVGVMTEQLVAAEVAHRGLTRLEVTSSMHERKARMAELSDGVIVLPGGFGTLDEAFEIVTWNQLGLVSSPVVFLDVLGYFAPLFDFIERSASTGFVRQAHSALARRTDVVADAIRLATSAPPGFASKWAE
jgi:uncharacterized protein (TIGR00730 family)